MNSYFTPLIANYKTLFIPFYHTHTHSSTRTRDLSEPVCTIYVYVGIRVRRVLNINTEILIFLHSFPLHVIRSRVRVNMKRVNICISLTGLYAVHTKYIRVPSNYKQNIINM